MTTLYEAVPGKKLKVFLVEEDKGRHEPLYMTILRLLHDAGVAGVTVFRGTEEFAERRRIINLGPGRSQPHIHSAARLGPPKRATARRKCMLTQGPAKKLIIYV